MFAFNAPEETWHVLDPEDDPTGEARILFRKWTAGDQLAYQDGMTTRALTKDQEGDTTARLGVLTLLHLALVCREARGFDDVTVTRDGVKTVEAFNPRSEEHLRLLPEPTFTRLSDAAKAYQPLPSARKKDVAKADTTGLSPQLAAAVEAAREDDPDGEVSDPFPTPPTPASAPVAAPPAPAVASVGMPL